MKKKAAKVPSEAKIAKLVRELLVELGENPERDGLKKTPLRVAKSLSFLTRGYRQDIAKVVNGARFASGTNHMVILKDIELYSLCEHHLVPFVGKAHVAYIPNGTIVGLSKIPRVVDAYARRMQVQERLTKQIKDCIQNTLNPLGVAVVIEAQHMCMSMRGVQKQNSVTTTSDFTGAFMKDPKTREEFMHIIGVDLH